MKLMRNGSQMPANVYGWSPLKALTGQAWRFIAAPRPELYDIKNDPAELHNLFEARPEVVLQLQATLHEYETRMRLRKAEAIEPDLELVAALESLGYIDGARIPKNDGIDPKDGLSLLKQFKRAKMLTKRGESQAALKILIDLKEQNPHNLPVLTHLAGAQLQSGETRAAVNTYRSARELNPESEFLAFNFARALDRSGQLEAAARAYRQVLVIDPRMASAWLNLAALTKDKAAKSRILREAIAAETESTFVYTQLSELEYAEGKLEEADVLLSEACRLTPELIGLWLLRGRVAKDRDLPLEAKAFYQQALALDRQNPEVMLNLAQIHLQLHESDDAHRLLLQIVQATPYSDSGRAAQSLLDRKAEWPTSLR